MVSDVDVLRQMWPLTAIGKPYVWLAKIGWLGNQTATQDETGYNHDRNGTGNDTDDMKNGTAATEQENRVIVDESKLMYMMFVSICILLRSILNLFTSNPLATLLRNARTKIMMNSRELERKDVPVPLGNY